MYKDKIRILFFGQISKLDNETKRYNIPPYVKIHTQQFGIEWNGFTNVWSW